MQSIQQPWTSVSLHLTPEEARTSEYAIQTQGKKLSDAALALAEDRVNKVVIQQENATLVLFPDGRYSIISALAGVVTSDDRKSVVRVRP